MRKVLGVVTAIAMLGLAGAASADEASGKIQSVDPGSRTITLDDGNAYIVSEGVAIDSLQPGSEVTVSFEEQNGQRVASGVTPQ
jgi:Cu/Ag efflux protein CusF